jgi:uncharacterized protein (UPF0333 family)
MKKKLKFFFLILSILIAFFGTSFALAQTTNPSTDPLSRLSRAASQAGLSLSPAAPQSIIFSIVVYLLGFIGLIFLIMLLIGGYQWLTSYGNEEKVKHAKDRLKSAIIGLVIILVAYIITTFVTQVLTKATCTGYYCYPTGAPSPCGSATTEEQCLNVPGGYCYWQGCDGPYGSGCGQYDNQTSCLNHQGDGCWWVGQCLE